MQYYFTVVSLLFLLSFMACKSESTAFITDSKGTAVLIEELPTFSKQGVYAVIEIPAGTNHKIEYKHGVFMADSLDGEARVIDFLPYPANYGFIPQTMMKASLGGDGDALDVLVICEQLPTGRVIEVKPIATLEMKDGGELDSKIIAIPVEEDLRVITAQNFEEFWVDYDAVRRIIEQWFMSYKGLGVIDLIGWKDQEYTVKLIKQRQIKKAN